MKSDFCAPTPSPSRLKTHIVRVGALSIGGLTRIKTQTMTTTDTMHTEATVAEVLRCVQAGADLVRITAPSIKEAQNLKNIKDRLRAQGCKVPLVADIHYTPKAAEIAARIVEKVRINPGNYADKKNFSVHTYTDATYREELERIHARLLPLLKICTQEGTAMRIGVNHGSLSDRIMSYYGDTPMGMVESAMEFLRIARAEHFHAIVLSMKSSNPIVMVQAYRLLVARMAEEFSLVYPLHLGVTEAGDGLAGRVKSAIGIGTLLEAGIGDTIRVSLTENPEFELPVCEAIIKCSERMRVGEKFILHSDKNEKFELNNYEDEEIKNKNEELNNHKNKNDRNDKNENFELSTNYGNENTKNKNEELNNHKSKNENFELSTNYENENTKNKNEELNNHKSKNENFELSTNYENENTKNKNEELNDYENQNVTNEKLNNDKNKNDKNGNLELNNYKNLNTKDENITLHNYENAILKNENLKLTKEENKNPSKKKTNYSTNENAQKNTYELKHYTRRKTKSILQAGDKNVPLVILDAREKTHEIAQDTERFFSDIGHVRAEDGVWTKQDAGADYLFLDSYDECVNYPDTLGIILPAEVWKKYVGDGKNKKYNPKNLYPCEAINEKKSVIISTDTPRFALWNVAEKDPCALWQYAEKYPCVVIAGNQNADNPTALRELFLQIEKNNFSAPLVLCAQADADLSEEEKIAHLSIYLGAPFLDARGEGVMISGAGRVANVDNDLSFSILQATRVRISKTEYISCPSCGRTLFDLQGTTARVRSATDHLKGLKIAVMGCIVNGPGEMADADFGYVGSGVGKITLYRGREVVKKNIDSDVAVDELVSLIKEYGFWREP